MPSGITSKGDIPIIMPNGSVLRPVFALDSASRAVGLMGVAGIGPGRGMLFVFPAGQAPRGMHMGGCLVPLDMAFLDAEGVALRNVTAEPFQGPHGPTIAAPEGTAFVLEMAAGCGPEEGQRIKIPGAGRLIASAT